MIRINKDLTRRSGGKIEKGALVDYQLNLESGSNTARILFKIYQSPEDKLAGSTHIPYEDILELFKDDKARRGGNFLIDHKIFKDVDLMINSYSDIVVKDFLEVAFFGKDSCEITIDKIED